MYIKKIHIKHYRGCQFVEFIPNKSLSALIGPNGSGKSTILSAIKLLSSLLDVKGYDYDFEALATSECELKVWYDWDGKKIKQSARLRITTDECNNDRVVSSNETWYMYDVTKRKKKYKIDTRSIAEAVFRRRVFLRRRSHENQLRNYYLGYYRSLPKNSEEAFSRIIQFISGLKYYSASQFTNPSKCPISISTEKVQKVSRGVNLVGHNRLLFDMYEEYKNETLGFQKFINLIEKKGIGLVDKIEFKEIETSTSEYKVQTGAKLISTEKVNYLVLPVFSVNGNLLSPSQLSEGTFKTIALIFYLVTDKSSLLMIEEPEVCVHHGLLESIIELIKQYSREKQIIISTHSDSVLDDLYIENVFKVWMDVEDGIGVSKIEKSLDKDELSVLKHHLRNEGSLGELWKHGGLEDV